MATSPTGHELTPAMEEWIAANRRTEPLTAEQERIVAGLFRTAATPDDGALEDGAA